MIISCNLREPSVQEVIAEKEIEKLVNVLQMNTGFFKTFFIKYVSCAISTSYNLFCFAGNIGCDL